VVGVGVVGCGAISRMHMDSFRSLEGVRLLAVSDKNGELARKTGEELGVDFYDSAEELLARDDIEIVSVCTPSGLHEEITIKAAQAGKHVIVEKPIEVTLSKIDNMIASCKKNGVKLACILNNRYREGNIFLKKALEAGRFGRLINVNAFVRWYREPAYYLNSDWRGTWALDGGGALMNQGIHTVDLLLWFAGDIESLCAYTGALLHRTIQTEDTASAAVKFRSGALGAVIASTSMYPGFPAEIQISGERGSASVSEGVIGTWSFLDRDALDEEAARYMGGSIDNRRACDPMGFDYTYHKKQLRRIIDAIQNGSEPEVSGEEARKPVEAILAIYEAAAGHREIRLG
jgi:UDP-N-acetyl-2-amino-2-deoxyglucuronate dehydrogenase